MGLRVPQKKKDAFAMKFKAWRQREGLSQEKAAKKLGILIHNIRNWEQGRTMPTGLAYTILTKMMKD